MHIVKGKFNDISEALKKKIPALKKGDVATFIMLNGVKNPDPDADEQRKRPVLYSKHDIPMLDKILDTDGVYKDICVADAWHGDVPAKLAFFMPGMHDGGLFMGKWSLFGGRAKDAEMYEQLMLTNYNKDSVLGEDRDMGIEPLFEVVNTKEMAKKSMDSIASLRKALELSAEMEEKEGVELGASLNWSIYSDWNELHAKIIEFAKDKPAEFLKVFQDPAKTLKSEIGAALHQQVINFDISTGKVTMGEHTILVLKKEDRGNFIETFALWFNTAKNSKEVRESIQAQLASKKG